MNCKNVAFKHRKVAPEGGKYPHSGVNNVEMSLNTRKAVFYFWFSRVILIAVSRG